LSLAKSSVRAKMPLIPSGPRKQSIHSRAIFGFAE